MITDQQQRAIVYLAVACRPHGARRWQEAGVAAAVAKVAHLSLTEVTLAVIRAASDRNAETPGVIPSNGPHWSEGSFTPAWTPDPIPANERCTVCSKRRPDCERVRFADDDHVFEPASNTGKRSPDAMAAIVQEAKARLEPTTQAADDDKPKPPPNPHVEAIRQQLHPPSSSVVHQQHNQEQPT